MVADAARRELVAVAGDVVLERLDRERILPLSASSPPCGIEKGLCENSTFFSSSSHSYIGKSTTQANSNRSLVDKLQILADFHAREPGEFGEFVRIASDEERGVARLEAERKADRLDALRADVIGERPAPAHAGGLRVGGKRRLVLRAVEEEHVAKPRLAFALRP